MKKCILLTILISLGFSAVYSQNSLLVAGSYITSKNNIYLSDGISLELGFQKNIKEKLFFQVGVEESIFRSNPNYSFYNEHSLDLPIIVFNDSDFKMRLSMFQIKTNFGYYFTENTRIQPFVLAGLSGIYIWQTYYIPSGMGTDVFTVNIKEDEQMSIGFQCQGGFLINLGEKFGIYTSAESSWLPFSKLGMQEIHLNSYNYQLGLRFKI